MSEPSQNKTKSRDLKHCDQIRLFRVKNGWVAADHKMPLDHELFFVFQSTEQLSTDLFNLIGEGGGPTGEITEDLTP